MFNVPEIPIKMFNHKLKKIPAFFTVTHFLISEPARRLDSVYQVKVVKLASAARVGATMLNNKY